MGSRGRVPTSEVGVNIWNKGPTHPAMHAFDNERILRTISIFASLSSRALFFNHNLIWTIVPIFIGERNTESEDRQRKHKIFFSSCVGTPPQGADWLFRISAKSGNILCLAFTPHSPLSHYPREKLHIWGGSWTASEPKIALCVLGSLFVMVGEYHAIIQRLACYQLHPWKIHEISGLFQNAIAVSYSPRKAMLNS